MAIKFNTDNKEGAYTIHYVEGERFVQINGGGENVSTVKFVKFSHNIDGRNVLMEMFTSKGTKHVIDGNPDSDPLKVSSESYEINKLAKSKLILGHNCLEYEITDHVAEKKIRCFTTAADINETTRLNLQYPKLPGTVLEFTDKFHAIAVKFMDEAEIKRFEHFDIEERQTKSQMFNFMEETMGISVNKLMQFLKNK